MENSKNIPAIYVGTYAKYNDGSIFGKWLSLTDYADKEEFYAACKELHKDEEDPEFMFQDWEYIPEEFIGESWLSENVFKAIEVQEAIENMEQSELMNLHNEYCNNNNIDDYIYDNDEEFLDSHFSSKSEAVKSALFGEYSFHHNWVTFDGYGNLESIEHISDYIDIKAITKDVIENPENYSI